MSSMSMTMAMSTPTSAASMSMTNMASTATAAAAATSSVTMDMGSSMSMGGCKISMTWNWNTIDACFISTSWRITSKGMFAGTCIGVMLLVMSLEFLRRLMREYDSYILRQNIKSRREALRQESSSYCSEENEVSSDKAGATANLRPVVSRGGRPRSTNDTALLQRQIIRALLHMVTFGVAYFVMLLAMYYNGYIIFSILIGAFLGAFMFSWDQLDRSCNEGNDNSDVTMCCG